MKKCIFIFLLISNYIFAQTGEIRGKIVDSETNNPLPYASILLAGTNSGTVSNLEGKFSFKLEQGSYKLIIRYVGYRRDTITVSIPQDKNIEIYLVKQAITLPDVLVTDEDPAYRIIREAIKRKKLNKKGLKNFEYNAYSKKVVKSAGEIALVEESFLKGYNKPGSWEKEFILETHKTENRKKTSQNMNMDFTKRFIVDFSADTINVLANEVYLPLCDNAFDYYNYKLINTIKTSSAPLYQIKVIARSKIQPLVEGEIYIDGDNYAICKVDLHNSKGLRFPYIHNLSINFKQTLGKYDGYRLPDYVDMKASFEFNFAGLIGIEPLSFQIVNSITGYKINSSVPDSVKDAVKSKYGGFTNDTSKNNKPPVEITSEKIESLRPIPLTTAETKAFATLDSTMTLQKSIKFKGALAGLIPESPEHQNSSGSNIVSKIMDYAGSYVYLDNNRVGYITPGVKYKADIFTKKNYVNTYAGYSLGMKKMVGQFLFGYNTPSSFFFDGVELGIFNTLKEWQPINPYSRILNSAIGFPRISRPI